MPALHCDHPWSEIVRRMEETVPAVFLTATLRAKVIAFGPSKRWRRYVDGLHCKVAYGHLHLTRRQGAERHVSKLRDTEVHQFSSVALLEFCHDPTGWRVHDAVSKVPVPEISGRELKNPLCSFRCHEKFTPTAHQ